MNDIHGFGIFDAKIYKTRVLGAEHPEFRDNDAFFKNVTDNTKAFTQSLLTEISSRHIMYNGGNKIMSEIPLPKEVKLQPVKVGEQIVDWVLSNPSKNIMVSQALLGHCFGPSFHFHIDYRNFKNKDGSLSVIPTMMVTGNSRTFFNVCQRFKMDEYGIRDNYGTNNPLPRPQMTYDLADYYERPRMQKRAQLNLSKTSAPKKGYQQLNGFYLEDLHFDDVKS